MGKKTKKIKKIEPKKANLPGIPFDKIHLIAVLLIILFCILLYGNILSTKFEFVYDDTYLIVENLLIKDFANLPQVLQDGRPLRTITYMIDYAIWGLDPFGFHLTNLILYVICSLMLYFWGREILKNNWQALILTILFVAHPIHTEAVTGIANRKEILMMFFFLLSFLCYLRGTFINDLISTIAFVFALLSKEVAITLPIILIFYDFFFVTNGNWRELLARRYRYLMYVLIAGFAFINYVSANIIFIALTFLAAIILPILVHGFRSKLTPQQRRIFGWGGSIILTGLVLFYITTHLSTIYHIRDRFFYLFSPEQTRGLPYDHVLWTTIRSFWYYFRLIFLPVNLNADHYLVPSESFFSAPVLASLFLLVMIVITAFWSAREYKWLSFALWFYLINLLPISNLIPAAYFVAERYLFLPSIGFCLFLMLGIWNLTIRWRRIGMAALIMVLVFYSARTVNRNLDWQSNFHLWRASLEVNPENPHAHFYLGNEYREMEDLERAKDHYLRSISLEPRQSRVLTNLGNIYYYRGEYENAIKFYESALNLEQGRVRIFSEYIYNNLGSAYFNLKKFDKAVKYLEKAVEIHAVAPDIRCNLGQAYTRTNQIEKARSEFEIALQLNPNYPEPYKYLGFLAYEVGDLQEAVRLWKIYLQKPISPTAKKQVEQYVIQAQKQLSP